ncbi:MAG: PKD domain-containing protein [Bacteroidia bacterium]
MNRLFLAFTTLLVLRTASPLLGQCPTANFNVQAQICAGDALQLVNNSSNAVRYEWDFCPGYLVNSPTLISDTTFSASYPGDITFALVDDTLFGFLSAMNNQAIVRFVYGNGPESAPTEITDLGNPGGLLTQPGDLALYQEQGKWYAIIADYSNLSVVRIAFGASLSNAPDSATTILPSAGSPLTAPRSIRLVQDPNGSIFGIVSNFTAATITILDFGTSILNTPTVSQTLSVPGTTFVLDCQPIRTCDRWMVLIAGYTSGKVLVGDFGNSLNNSPAFSDMTVFGQPSDLVTFLDGDHWRMVYTSFTGNELVRYDLGTDITLPTPTLLGVDGFGSLYPKGVSATRIGDVWYLSVLDIGNSRIRFMKDSHTCPAALSTSQDFEPTGVTFTTPGVQTIVLTAWDNNGIASVYAQQVSVASRPIAAFGFTGSCFGDLTEFQDSTDSGGGAVTNWNWQFGTGDSSNSQNPVYVYPAAGNYPVSLTVSGSAGCSSTILDTVHISPLPVAAFTTGTGCSETLIDFTDLSSAPSDTITSWHWEFGTGDTSDLQSPQYAFTTGGNYTISLTITNSIGCSAGSTDVLFVNDRPRAAFDATNTCVGQQVQFVDLTDISGAAIIDRSWDFGDGQTSTSTNPGHIYTGGVADYAVQYIVTADNGCIDTVDQVIRINNIPTPNFTFLPTTACQGSEVRFTDLSVVTGDTISGWRWDFGDGTLDTVPNPIHRFYTPGQNTISLIAYAPSNCPSSIFQQTIDIIESPVADFVVDEACDGVAIGFTDLSTAPSGSSIQRYEWDFGDGDTAMSANPSHLYPGIGTFPVVLTVMSNFGCTDSVSQLVSVHPYPTASFTYINPCEGQPMQFTQTSTVDTPSVVSTFYWNFGDFGSSQNTSSLEHPSHIYSSLQSYTVYLVATTDYGCSDTAAQTVQINPAAPVNFNYSPTCYGELMEFFNPGSAQDSLFLWNFGDNQTNQVQEPAHYYAFPGTYTVTLTVTSFSGCISTASRQVTVSPIPEAGFSTQPACVNTEYTFVDTSRISIGSITNWTWSLPDGTMLSGFAPVYTFADTGTLSVTLDVVSDIGCEASVTRDIRIHPLPVANFDFDPQFGNPPLEVNFSDLSQLGQTYSWDFGDGATSSQMNPTHLYTDTGLFVITEYVTSPFGCLDSIHKNIYVIQPILDLAVTGDSSYIDGSYFHIVARVANLGTRPIDRYRLEARLDGGSTIQEVSNELLPNGPTGIQWYNFRAAFLLNEGATPDYYCIRALDPNDESDDVPGNNERCFNRTPNLLISDPYPNPFTNESVLDIFLPNSDQLEVVLFDGSGKIVQDLFNGKGTKGLNRIRVSGSGLASGVYSLRVIFRDQVLQRHLIRGNDLR